MSNKKNYQKTKQLDERSQIQQKQYNNMKDAKQLKPKQLQKMMHSNYTVSDKLK